MKKPLKQRFNERLAEVETPRMISVAVKLPNGAIEVITNYEGLTEKAEYYQSMYDNDFQLVHNAEVQIVSFMIV